MFKVVIIDDEVWTVRGIKASCNWAKHDCKIVFDTTSPLEALDYIITTSPDIVLVDINMDELSGLDLINKVRLKGIPTEFIIISGYDEFDYAKSAIQYGVFDYILKPIDRMVLEETLKRLVDYLNLKTRTHSALKLAYIERILQEQEINFDHIFEKEKVSPIYKGYQIAILEDNYCLNDVKDLFITDQSLCLVYPLGKNKYVLFINTQVDITEIFSLDKMKVPLGISSFSLNKKQYKKLYMEADKAFCNNFIESNKAYKYEPSSIKGTITVHNVLNVKLLEDYVKNLEEHVMENAFTVEELCLIYNGILVICHYYQKDDRIFNFIAYDEIYKNFKDLEDLKAFLLDLLKNIGDENPHDQMDDAMNEIMAYIQTHYDKNIYLSDLSEKFYYNQTYICSLFKKHLNKTFTEYLKELRMKKACDLLLETRDSIVTIASKVGYNDYCYFSKIFKNLKGVTPLQFRHNG